MKRILFSIALITGVASFYAFCGFYVAKADTKLFNKTSQVIIEQLRIRLSDIKSTECIEGCNTRD